MPARFKCPHCLAVIQIQDDQYDIPVACTSCGKQLRVKRPAPSAPSIPKSEAPPNTAGSEKKKGDDRDDPEFFSPIMSDFLFDGKKKKPAKNSDRDDDDEAEGNRERNDDVRPANRRRRAERDDRDEEDDRPRNRRDGRSSSDERRNKSDSRKDKEPKKSNLLIVGIVVGILALVGGGIGIYFAVKGSSKTSETQIVQNKPETEKKDKIDKKDGDTNPKDTVVPKKEKEEGKTVVPKKAKEEGMKEAPKGLDQTEITRLGRAATAFIQVKKLTGQPSSGTAFCIHPSGFFLTAEHVVRNGREFKVVLSPNTPDEKVLGVKIVRNDFLNDLALLQVEQETTGLEFLSLGGSAKVTQLQPLVAFGFPFGEKLALDKGYPAISVNSILVSSLRERNGVLHRIQMDGALNPGHSGGPVLDKDGKVAGVVVSGIVGSGSALAIPSPVIEIFARTPIFTIEPLQIAEKDRGKEVTLSGKVADFVLSSVPSKVEFTVKIGSRIEKVPGERVGDLCQAKFKVPDDTIISRGAPVWFTITCTSDGKYTAASQRMSFITGDAVAVVPKMPDPKVVDPKIPTPKKPDPKIPDPMPEPKPALNEQIVKLPDSVEAVCLGGNGRFVILTLARDRKIAVLDTTLNKIVKYIPTTEDKVLVAASQDKLLVIGVDNRTIQRWSLATFEKELTLPLPIEAVPSMALLGHASDGPLMVRTGGDRFGGGMHFIDLKTLKAADITATKNANGGFGVDGQVGRVSADGKTFGMWRRDTSPSGFITVVLTGSTFKSYYQHESPGHIAPNANGSMIHTSTGGFSIEGKSLGRDGDRFGRRFEFPAIDKSYFLVVENDGLKLYMTSNRKLLMTIPVKSPGGLNQWAREKIGYDQRIMFLAREKKIVILPETNDRVLIYDFDVDKALAESGLDYLIVASDPVKVAAKGKLYRCPIRVKSKQGEVKITIDAGPTGMSLDKDNNLIWAVPENPTEETADVILSITDKSAQQELVSFKIVVKDAKDVPGAEPIPPDLIAKLPKLDPKVDPKVEMPPAKEQKIDQDKIEVKLVGAIDSLCIGGGGRYIILHLATERKLAIFDATLLKIVKYLPVAEDSISFAASRELLIVGFPKARAIQRWNLKTLEKEATVPLPGKGELSGLAMGHDSNGPLLIQSSTGDNFNSGGCTLHNPKSLQLLQVKTDGGDGKVIPLSGTAQVNASANGKVFACYEQRFQDFKVLVYDGTSIKTQGNGKIGGGTGPGYPSADGKVIYTFGGPRSVNGTLLNDKKDKVDIFTSSLQIPSVQGNYYLEVHTERDRNNPIKSSVARIGIHMADQRTPLVTLRDILVSTPEFGRKFDINQRLLYLPNYSILAAIPESKDVLVLHKIDVDGLLEKSGIDYLVVMSSPITMAIKGKDYDYSLKVKSKQGSVTYKLESGPEGMAIDKEGKLTWKVPASFSEKQADVLILVSDKSAQEIFHTFKIEVVEK